MTDTQTSVIDKKQIREMMRKKRSGLSSDALSIAAAQIAKNAEGCAPLIKAKKIASYLPSNGEISPIVLQQKHTADFYLPRISSVEHSTMKFYSANNPLVPNRFTILEPVADGDIQALTDVDIVLLPLLAFDKTGNRLGMGGGFYDRALAFKQNQGVSSPPYLIGLAHHFQEIEQLPAEHWDIPLDAILTDQQLITIHR